VAWVQLKVLRFRRRFAVDLFAKTAMLSSMKPHFVGLLVAAVCFGAAQAQAQYKAPSQYFRKDFPAPNNRGTPPAAPKAPDKQAPAASQQPKFKDLPVDSQFFFTSDTNRSYAWTKISATSAKNTKNGVTQAINAETPIQK
jgi:hypothetical protein